MSKATDRFYKSRAWFYFSRVVLLKKARLTSGGLMCKCTTCGAFHPLNSKQMQAGHYRKVFDANTSNFATAFDERNVFPQCMRCNKYRGGAMDEASLYIEETYGLGTCAELIRKSKNPTKLDVLFLENIKEIYKGMYKKLIKIKGNPWG